MLSADGRHTAVPARPETTVRITSRRGAGDTGSIGQTRRGHTVHPGSPELGSAGDFTSDNYFRGAGVLDRSHDTTVQFWVKLRSFIDTL